MAFDALPFLRRGKLLESVAGAQKEWADFMTRRIREDVRVSQQLVGCRSLADCNYLRKAMDQYQEQSQLIGRLGGASGTRERPARQALEV